MQSMSVRGATFHVEAKLRPERPSVVFVHALGADLRIWDDVVEALARADVGTLRYDFRGHGLSDLGVPPRVMADHAADLAAILKTAGVEKATVCGVSAGGMIALALADAHPEHVERLVLCCTGAKIGTSETWNLRIESVERSGVADLAEAVLQRWFPPADYVRGGGALALCRNMLANTSRAGYIATSVTLRDSDLTEAARRLKVPALVIAGDSDGSTPPDFVRDFAALIPGAEFKLIAGAGHLPPLQQPAILSREILDFLGCTSG